MTIKWKAIPGYEYRYEISTNGDIRSIDSYLNGNGGSKYFRKGSMMSTFINPRGYTQINLIKPDGKRKSELVHRLVLKTFIGELPQGQMGLHKDDNKRNNKLSNLYYGSAQDNADDRVRNGSQLNGYNHPMAKVTPLDLKLIPLLRELGHSWTAVAEVLGVEKSTAQKALKRQTFSPALTV